jgi:UDP-N-acetylglucosamine 2-epimerase (non-hydrolysing)
MAIGLPPPDLIRIVSVAGTRPEAIKLAPIALAAAGRADLAHQLWATGQQDRLFDDAIASVGVSVDRHLGAHPGGDTNETQVAKLATAIRAALTDDRPTLLLVQGDTNSALAGARAAHDLRISIGHIEAGLRTHNPQRPFPEEANRVEIAKLATLHFAPSAGAAANLEAERINTNVHITGNPGIDALMRLVRGRTTTNAQPTILVTCHRRENFGAPLVRICEAILDVAALGAQIILPVHSNPAVANPIRATLGHHPSIQLVAPLDYPAMIAAIRSSTFVLSDSGGLQEECAALGVPLLLMRDETERPEVIASGNCILVGSDCTTIVRESRRLLTDPAHHARMSLPAWPYGKGNAADKILDAIADWHRDQRLR